jgi:SAM-dependent methyltransferase
MDLREVTKNKKRHPWEIARARALRNIIKKRANVQSVLRVLDVGCGDAFMVRELIKGLHVECVDGIDINLSDQRIKELSLSENDIIFHNKFNSLKKRYYNLVFMLDIIEHVENDAAFLSEIVNKHMVSGGVILITAPAFNFLFSSHDTFLGHFRRYNLEELLGLIRSLHLKQLFSGYLFFSLVPLRFLMVCYERFVSTHTFQKKGVGHWNYGVILTKTIELILMIDNNISITLSKNGIKLPGLTVWALCKKQL